VAKNTAYVSTISTCVYKHDSIRWSDGVNVSILGDDNMRVGVKRAHVLMSYYGLPWESSQRFKDNASSALTKSGSFRYLKKNVA